MKKSLLPFIALLAGSVLTTWAQDPAPAPPEPQEAQEPAELAPPPRVVGQAQTQAEVDAWQVIESTTGDDQKLPLYQQFLQDFPESGLTPFVHYNLAMIYRRQNDPDNFILHGEKALEELPQLADLEAYLAFFYAEKGLSNKAVLRANSALGNLESMERPDQTTGAQWAAQKYELKSEAHYALGRVFLTRATGATDPNVVADALGKSVENLEMALNETPTHPYAAFRLGEAYTRQEKLEQALNAYARTVAIGGVIGEYARGQLQRVYEFVHKNTDGMQALIDEQKSMLQKAAAEREAELKAIEQAEMEAAETSVVPPAAPPDKPPLA